MTVFEGLEGVVVTRTRLSHVDGEAGRLIVAGLDVGELAARHDFESACALLFTAAGEPSSAAEVRERLAVGRERAFLRLAQLGDALERSDPMDALRAAVAHLPETASREDIIAACAVFTAAYLRQREGQAPLSPPPGASHAEALLAMLGRAHEPARVRALDAYLVTVMDHGLNASTFAARVVASTRSDLVSSVVAGIGALKGPLHGGAPGPVLDMLTNIGSAERASAFLSAELGAGRRIMGMGHRIYRQRDPRAEVLERALEALQQSLSDSGSAHDSEAGARLSLARAVERHAEELLASRYPGRHLRANVEFYTAVLLSGLDLPSRLFACLFACARAAGWSAHVAEQLKTGRLIRPSAEYIGTLPA
jgi:citrate synthase